MEVLSEKIDELALRMDNGFNRVDADIRALREETKSEFDKVDKRFERIDERFESLYRLMFQFSGSLAVALVGAVAILISRL